MSTLPPLWNHQKQALSRVLSRGGTTRFGLFFDPGCGKSRTTLEIFNESIYGSMIIFAPLNVCRNWVNEIKTYGKKSVKTFVVAGQTKDKKMEIIKEFHHTIALENKGAVLIINYECLRSKDYTVLLHRCTPIKFIVADESHNFKGWKSQQTLGLLELVKRLKPEHLYLLTGTPAPQGEIDLWSTFTLLGVTNLPFFVWRKKYFDDRNARRAGTTGYYPDYEIRPSSKIEFQKMLAACSMVAKKSEVLDLPPMLYQNVFCELSPEQRRHYETMEKFLFAIDEEGHELNAANILSRTMRLQQIVAGWLGDVPVKKNPRLEALDYAIEVTGKEQFIIWTIFKHTYSELGKRLSDMDIGHGFITGEQSAEDRQQSMAEFQAGKLRCLIAHPKAGGVGVNLTAGKWSIYYTRNFNLVDDIQSEARNYRGGSEIHEKITRIDIIAENTIDEDITSALRAKADVQDFILGLKNNRRK
jgi:SNF2 family DNA or RNA helicase